MAYKRIFLCWTLLLIKWWQKKMLVIFVIQIFGQSRLLQMLLSQTVILKLKWISILEFQKLFAYFKKSVHLFKFCLQTKQYFDSKKIPISKICSKIQKLFTCFFSQIGIFWEFQMMFLFWIYSTNSKNIFLFKICYNIRKY